MSFTESPPSPRAARGNLIESRNTKTVPSPARDCGVARPLPMVVTSSRFDGVPSPGISLYWGVCFRPWSEVLFSPKPTVRAKHLAVAERRGLCGCLSVYPLECSVSRKSVRRVTRLEKWLDGSRKSFVPCLTQRQKFNDSDFPAHDALRVTSLSDCNSEPAKNDCPTLSAGTAPRRVRTTGTFAHSPSQSESIPQVIGLLDSSRG